MDLSIMKKHRNDKRIFGQTCFNRISLPAFDAKEDLKEAFARRAVLNQQEKHQKSYSCGVNCLQQNWMSSSRTDVRGCSQSPKRKENQISREDRGSGEKSSREKKLCVRFVGGHKKHESATSYSAKKENSVQLLSQKYETHLRLYNEQQERMKRKHRLVQQRLEKESAPKKISRSPTRTFK